MTNILAGKVKELGRPLVLDGAVGSLLIGKGVKPDPVLWTALAGTENPELLTEIHKNYISAGADIITANTFRSNPAAAEKAGYSSDELVKANVSAALKVAENTGVIVAGSNAPAEDCYFPGRTLSLKNLEENHEKHIISLYKYGCDIIWNETFSQLDEITIVSKICEKYNLPFIVSLLFDENLKLFSGEHISKAVEVILDSGALAAGFNCISKTVFPKLKKEINIMFPWGFYLNCGSGSYNDEILKCGVSPGEYRGIVSDSLDKNLLFAGSCCGSGYTHTKVIRDLLDE